MAFRMVGDGRTGIIVMEDSQMMMVAVNMYKDEGYQWVMDSLPGEQEVELYEVNEAERLWGYKYFLSEFGYEIPSRGVHPLFDFVDHECPNERQRYTDKEEFCQDFLLHVPKLFAPTEWAGIKQAVWVRICQSLGLQYNRYRTEYYCFLIGVLMIAEREKTEYTRNRLLRKMQWNWRHLSWMYGMVLGRLIGTEYKNFTALVRQTGQGSRKAYLHLYLPLVENNIDKICHYNPDKPQKLRDAISIMRRQEALEEQKTDLDELYKILFPNHFVLAMSAERPAATIAELKQEMEEKEMKIVELESALETSIKKFNVRYEELLHNFEALALESVSFDEIEKGLCNLSRGMAEAVLGQLSITLSGNNKFMVQLPRLHQAIKDNDKSSTEIHNHFEAGSTAQVFNGPTTGEFKK